MSDIDAQGHEWRDGLRYPWPQAPANGQVQVVAEGVLWLRMPLPFGLDHINLYLLRHGDGWVAVDTGLNSDQCRAVWEQVFVEVCAGLPLKAVICTHFHSDHAGVSGWLTERFRCPLLMTLGEFDALHHGPPMAATPDWAFLDFYLKAGFTAERATSLLPLIQGEHFRPQSPAGFVRLRHGNELTIGGRRWQVVMGNGHSPEHACLYAPDDGLLISGDQVLPRITSTIAVYVTEPAANPLRDWLASIERLRVIPDSVLVLPAHERPFFNLHLRLDQLRDHHLAHLQQLLDACTQPRTALEMMAVLFKKLSGRFDELMAVGETLAHANYLMAEGALVREEQGGLHRYRVAPTGVAKFNPLELI
ncbi:MBL fold metallo-hydrolase [Pseudomonas sp. NPDC096917]|uniref:MBL fold metallo-hydrolase n=1 Tax=Pseudomonas sp. NPDC096917 TaxID=3364483 RepID=UPI00383B9F46